MENIIEKQFNAGALPSPQDNRDHVWSETELGKVAAPFDWEKGFDVEEELNFKLKIKNQNGSFSCSGQAGSYYGEVLEKAETKTYEPRSAKFIYAPIAQYGGGAFMRDIFKIALGRGFCEETLCPSYENGNAPTEAFMTRLNDITPEAIENAKKTLGRGYANVNPRNIDEIAQATRENCGALILIRGENNGTWLTAFPKIPSVAGGTWGHFLYCGKAKLINGEKYIGVANSWGEGVGEDGWQWLDKEHFEKLFVIECRTLYLKPKFKHTFSTPILYGQRGEEVKALQQALKEDGVFNVEPTGYYGEITRVAVLNFQYKYDVASYEELNELKGKRVGAKTIAKLNELFK